MAQQEDHLDYQEADAPCVVRRLVANTSVRTLRHFSTTANGDVDVGLTASVSPALLHFKSS